MGHSLFWPLQKCPLRLLHGCKKQNKDNSSLIFNISDTHLGRNRSPFFMKQLRRLWFSEVMRWPTSPPPALRSLHFLIKQSAADPAVWQEAASVCQLRHKDIRGGGRLLRGAGPCMCHDIIMVGMIGRAAQVVFYSLPLQSRAVIKRYGRTHECRFLNGAGWSGAAVI